MSPPDTGPLLTLEPFIEAVRRGVEAAGWLTSGLQKTTSYQFEGRWEGESTRSAYLFFHRSDRWEGAGIDAYLDETSRGLQGNVSLAVDGPPLAALGDPSAALALLAGAAAERLPPDLRASLSLRFRLPRPSADPATSEVEIRFKLVLPGAALERGAGAVTEAATDAVRALESLLEHPAARNLVVLD